MLGVRWVRCDCTSHLLVTWVQMVQVQIAPRTDRLLDSTPRTLRRSPRTYRTPSTAPNRTPSTLRTYRTPCMSSGVSRPS